MKRKRKSPEPEFCSIIRRASPERLAEVKAHLQRTLDALRGEYGKTGMLKGLETVVNRFCGEPAILLNIDPIMRNVILEAVEKGVPQ